MPRLNEKYGNLSVGGTDFSEKSIAVAKKVFPRDANNFWVQSMIDPHTRIKSNTYDHVFSFGAMGMYLRHNELFRTVQEAIRIAKPGGSLLFTNFLEPNGTCVGSIVDRVEKNWWFDHQEELGVYGTAIHGMVKSQGDRYAVCLTKKR